MCLYFPLTSVPVRHWHAGGVCVPAHPRRGQDSAGAAAEPGNAHKVSQPTWKTSSRHRESALSRSVAVFFFKNGRPFTNVPSRPSLWGTSVLRPDAAFGAALRLSEEEWWVKKKEKEKERLLWNPSLVAVAVKALECTLSLTESCWMLLSLRNPSPALGVELNTLLLHGVQTMDRYPRPLLLQSHLPSPPPHQSPLPPFPTSRLVIPQPPQFDFWARHFTLRVSCSLISCRRLCLFALFV